MTLSTILSILSDIPTIISLIEKLIAAVEAGQESLTVTIDTRKMIAALQEAQASKDTSGIENILNPPSATVQPVQKTQTHESENPTPDPTLYAHH